MNKYAVTCLLFFLFLCGSKTRAQKTSGSSFKIIPLGVKGGSDESNLSAYMLAATGSSEYICLDAGTIHFGIQKAVDAGVFKGPVTGILKNNIKAYLISHPHLDHVAGLVINSPDDSAKNIYGLPFCLDVLRDNYFTWKNWANFADAGERPYLNKYHYAMLSPGTETAIEHTSMLVTAFYLSHSNPYKSTAFLIRNADAYILYLGDSGADTTEHANNLQLLWQATGPLIKAKKLKAIFIEVSFSNEQPDKLLFGHLTPRLLMQEMNALSRLTGAAALKNFPIIITHEKPGSNREVIIKKQLNGLNQLKLKLVFPQQAVPLGF